MTQVENIISLIIYEGGNYMNTSVVGFPRIGENRELKFSIEKYFRGEIDSKELKKSAETLRKRHLEVQKNAGINYISTNDFSYYDLMLDTIVMLGLVPTRYKELNLSDIDTYFAMARGYQKDGKDVHALAMKKWFNTNYHYVVPEIEDALKLEINLDKLIREYHEALSYGIETKPVIIGPFTFHKLARIKGNRDSKEFLASLVKAYSNILKECDNEGISLIQIDEPALVFDLTDEEKQDFIKSYKEILGQDLNTKVLLQTYFGDVRDIYNELLELDFWGLGLDLVEGKENLNLIEKNGLNRKVLFAGLVNGKNVWKNDFSKTLGIVDRLKEKDIEIVLQTSCSLLHVPYTTKGEDKLSEQYLSHLSFAYEKLDELRILGDLADNKDYRTTDIFINNQNLLNSDRNSFNQDVKDRLDKITDKDFVRTPARNERSKIQRKAFNLPHFPTTTIGSFPQTKEVKENRSLYKKGEKSKEDYIAFNKEKIKACVEWQEEVGLDVLVHGEYERNDMVEYFGEALNGFIFTKKAWVQSYGIRCVKPPIIWGDVYRTKPITLDWILYAKSLTNKPMKGMLTGPVTILNWSFPREDISIKESIYQIALAIRDEVLDLEANGVNIIQIDEAALREKLPLRKTDWHSEYLSFAIPAFRLTHSGVKPETQIHTHMCYSEFTDIIKEIDDMDADVITFEASKSDLLILDSLKDNDFETEVGPGVYDIHSPRVPSVEEIEKALKIMLTKVDKDKLWVNPDCGLKTRGIKETKESLTNLVQAAKNLRNVVYL